MLTISSPSTTRVPSAAVARRHLRRTRAAYKMSKELPSTDEEKNAEDLKLKDYLFRKEGGDDPMLSDSACNSRTVLLTDQAL